MKTERNLERAARARLNQAQAKADALIVEIENIRSGGFTKEGMAEMRDLANEIAQCIHEYNAYINAART